MFLPMNKQSMHIPEVTEMLITDRENFSCTITLFSIYCIKYMIHLSIIFHETEETRKVHLAMEQQAEVRDHDAKIAPRGRGQRVIMQEVKALPWPYIHLQF